MVKFYKIFILIIAVGAILATVFLFYPTAKKEIKSEKTEILSENFQAPEEINSIEATPDPISETKNIEKPAKEEDKKETAQEDSEEKSGANFKIIQNSINWGYSSKSSRSIDTIIIHSSYNVLTEDPYNFKKLLEEYKSYGVAPHYVIDRKGNIYQLIKDNNIAYHTGESKMPDGRTNVNNFSIGIEMMNTESDKMTEAQYASLRKLIAYLKEKYKIKDILGHNQIAPGRKTDPWKFDWSKI